MRENSGLSVVDNLIFLLLLFFPQGLCNPIPIAAFKNTTITVSEGTTNHSDPRILSPTKWTSIIALFLETMLPMPPV
jgi:hypothetical protein